MTSERTATKAQFARDIGVSKPFVTKLTKQGMPVNSDGIPVNEALRWLHANGKLPEGAKGLIEELRQAEQQPAEATERPETHEGLRALLDRLDLMTKAEAEQVKENYLALQRRLEYDTAAGEVVPVDEAAQKVAEEYAAVRSRLLSLPTELAPTIAQESGGDANRIRERLLEGITRVLEELTQG